MNDILKQYFAFSNQDEAIDFIYKHLNTELSARHYEVVDTYLEAIMNNSEWWQKGIDLPVFSLSFAMWTGHEPTKFKNREEFMQRLHTDYVSKHGELRADRLLVGLKKGIKMPQMLDKNRK